MVLNVGAVPLGMVPPVAPGCITPAGVWVVPVFPLNVGGGSWVRGEGIPEGPVTEGCVSGVAGLKAGGVGRPCNVGCVTAPGTVLVRPGATGFTPEGKAVPGSAGRPPGAPVNAGVLMGAGFGFTLMSAALN